MNECILFDENGKEIDWYDPVDGAIESENVLTINHSSGNIYTVDRKNYSSFIVREKP